MGIYIFNFKTLKNELQELSNVPNCDFGMHVIPHIHRRGGKLYSYQFNSYWKDVGTLGTYWEANMELTDLVPEFNLYEEFWQIYTSAEAYPPAYIAEGGKAESSIVGDGSSIEGSVKHSVLGANVKIAPGAKIRDSVIMNGVVIGEGAVIRKAIIAENTVIGAGTHIGEGFFAASRLDPRVYNNDITVVGANSVIPENVSIGKNVAIMGKTVPEDYPNGVLESGDYIIKKGGRA